jgi:hypothetical protein
MSKKTISASATGLPSNPMNEEPKRASSEHLARAFQDLESPVCDLKNMSLLLESIIESDIRRDKEKGGYIELLLSKDQFDCLHFAVLHLGDMIRDLYRVYYAGLEEEASDG